MEQLLQLMQHQQQEVEVVEQPLFKQQELVDQVVVEQVQLHQEMELQEQLILVVVEVEHNLLQTLQVLEVQEL
jgi:hypothetical protein